MSIRDMYCFIHIWHNIILGKYQPQLLFEDITEKKGPLVLTACV